MIQQVFDLRRCTRKPHAIQCFYVNFCKNIDALRAAGVAELVMAGGILAVANNAAACCDHVKELTPLGDRDSHTGFCREHLVGEVTPVFLTRGDAPTIVKRRRPSGPM